MERKKDSHITTFTGIWFYPTAPDPDDILIEDIAHCLPLICRGNGHVIRFWSVGSHSICCALEAEARGLGPETALACLLHDASECYMSDVPRPFKSSMPEYIRMEQALTEMIYIKFIGRPLTAEEENEVRHIDDDMLWYDLKYLLNEEAGEEPLVRVKPDFEFRPFREVEKQFTELFERYTAKLKERKDD